jgi:tRNA threonylcarbamoyladenosine biosynthesis protein TsaE
MSRQEWITSSAEQTRALGAALGAAAQPGDIVALTGDLGAGKTTLVQGVAAALGLSGYVPSPTFTLIREYHLPAGRHGGSLRLYHVDLYRLTPPDVEAIGLGELFDEGAVVVVEWAERAGDILPADVLSVEMRILEGDRRALVVHPGGAGSAALADRWVAEARRRRLAGPRAAEAAARRSG